MTSTDTNVWAHIALMDMLAQARLEAAHDALTALVAGVAAERTGQHKRRAEHPATDRAGVDTAPARVL